MDRVPHPWPFRGLVLRTPRLELRPDDWSVHFLIRFEGLEPCLPVLGL